jgi:hypothetical protein
MDIVGKHIAKLAHEASAAKWMDSAGLPNQTVTEDTEVEAEATEKNHGLVRQWVWIVCALDHCG